MTSFTVKHSHLLGSFRPNKPPAVSHCLIGNVTSYGRTIDVAIYSIATDLVSFSCFMSHRLQRRIWPLSCGLLYAERWHLYYFFFFGFSHPVTSDAKRLFASVLDSEKDVLCVFFTLGFLISNEINISLFHIGGHLSVSVLIEHTKFQDLISIIIVICVKWEVDPAVSIKESRISKFRSNFNWNSLCSLWD